MKHNILMITCDQLRKDALGCYGDPVVKTPNIDWLASQGVRCDEMYVTCPVCAPNRAAIATGRFPSVNGVPENGCILPKDEVTLMETLSREGYATYGIGKMHFGPQWTFEKGDYQSANDYNGGPGAVNPQPYPWEFPFYGFEKGMFTEDNRVGPYADYLEKHGLDAFSDPHSFTFGQHVTVQSAWPEEHHQTTWVANRAIDFLSEHSDEKPLFMWVSFIHPHSPFNPPTPYDTMYDPEDIPLPIRSEEEIEGWPEVYKQNYLSKDTHHGGVSYSEFTDTDWRKIKAYYYGMISLIDKQIGRIIDTLKQKNMLENTIIVFTADHGEMMGDHHLLLKGTQYDCVTSVPFIIKPPKQLTVSEEWDGLSQSIDIMPTLLDMVNVPIPKGVQGKSLVPALYDKEIQLYEDVLVEMNNVRTLRTENMRISWHGAEQKGELYDLTKDPHCFNNLWDKPEAAKRQYTLMKRLIDRVIKNKDPLKTRKALC